MTNKLPISALLVIYNEGTILERCLSSFADLVDEIIIVHDGECTDDSLEIAKRYDAKVLTWERKKNCERHRGALMALARNEWVLQIDADEYLSPEFRQAIPDLIKMPFDGHRFNWPIWYKDRYYKYGHKLALYKKERFYHISVNHEYPKPVDENVKINTTELLLEHKPKFVHFEKGVFLTKLIPRAQVHARRLLVPFDQLEKWNCPLTKWDSRQQMLLDHPIVIGMFATFVFLFVRDARRAIEYRDATYLRFGFIMGAWFASVYYFYFRYKHEPRSSGSIYAG